MSEKGPAGERGKDIIKAAKDVLNANRQIVRFKTRTGLEERLLVRPPDKGFYEGNWLWDTGFNELGVAIFNPKEAAEIFLNFIRFSQWRNGFIPHILFYQKNQERYFPGTVYWKIERSENCPDAYTSGITQPPVLGFCALRIYEGLKEKTPEGAERFLIEAYPRLLEFHRYLFEARDPERVGLVSIYHPWESGLDNSPRWQVPLLRIPTTVEQLEEIRRLRRDVGALTEKLKSEGVEETRARELAFKMRPADEDYARYLALVRFMAERDYDDERIYPETLFNVKDVLFNSVLYTSNEALLVLAYELKEKTTEEEKKKIEADVRELKGYLEKQRKGFKKLYDEESGLYYDLDVKTKKLIKRKTIACFMPLFAGLPSQAQAQRMAEIAKGPEFKSESEKFLIPSTAKSDPSFHPLAYWRGPIWLPVNWLVARGFERMGLVAEAEEIRRALLDLVSQKGFYEYFHPDNLQGLGRENFSWTASLAIELNEEPNFWKKLWQVG